MDQYSAIDGVAARHGFEHGWFYALNDGEENQLRDAAFAKNVLLRMRVEACDECTQTEATAEAQRASYGSAVAAPWEDATVSVVVGSAANVDEVFEAFPKTVHRGAWLTYEFSLTKSRWRKFRRACAVYARNAADNSIASYAEGHCVPPADAATCMGTNNCGIGDAAAPHTTVTGCEAAALGTAADYVCCTCARNDSESFVRPLPWADGEPLAGVKLEQAGFIVRSADRSGVAQRAHVSWFGVAGHTPCEKHNERTCPPSLEYYYGDDFCNVHTGYCDCANAGPFSIEPAGEFSFCHDLRHSEAFDFLPCGYCPPPRMRIYTGDTPGAVCDHDAFLADCICLQAQKPGDMGYHVDYHDRSAFGTFAFQSKVIAN